MLMKWIREMLWRAYALINQIYLKFAALASMASITSFAKFDSCRIPPYKFAYFSYGLHSKAKHSTVNHIQCTMHMAFMRKDPEILKIINIGLTLLLVWGRNWFFVSFWQLWLIKKFSCTLSSPEFDIYPLSIFRWGWIFFYPGIN